jgi:hypothetical protein
MSRMSGQAQTGGPDVVTLGMGDQGPEVGAA